MRTAERTSPELSVEQELNDVEIVVPVYNEEAELESSVLSLRRYLDSTFPFPATVTVADNASTDRTWEIACRLARQVPGVRAIHLDKKGRGRALRAAWSASPAAVVAYMDVDLATDLDALLPLVAPLLSGHSDVAIGSRLARGAHVVRGPKREVISRCYNLLVRTTLRNGFSDAQCGFKALRAEVARELLPQVRDNSWFFDTELLVRAERAGKRIHEVPVDWVDDPDSRVDIARTALDDLKGIWRLVTERPAPGARPVEAADREEQVAELGRFARVGVLSTLAYLVLFFLLEPAAGAYAANLVSLVLCTAVNTVAHRRFTFSGRGPVSWRTGLLGGAAVLTTSLVLTTGALLVTDSLFAGSTMAQLAALVGATAVAAAVRFVLLRAWVFHSLDRRPTGPGPAPVVAPTNDAA